MATWLKEDIRHRTLKIVCPPQAEAEGFPSIGGDPL
jgi:hypothetical protein